MRENARAKGMRYLSEHRVRVLDCSEDAGTFVGEVRGTGRVYVVAHGADGWSCSCPAFTENCCHVLACKAITVFAPRETR
jgi:hypothetical protein